MNEDNDEINEDFKELRLEPNYPSKKCISSIKVTFNFKASITPDKRTSQIQKTADNIQNMNYSEINNILKQTNRATLKKYSNNLDKKIKYFKVMNDQLSLHNIHNNTVISQNNKNNSNKKDISKNNLHHSTNSTFENSDNRTYIRSEFENTTYLKQRNQRIYDEIIQKNIPIKKRKNKNDFFKLKKYAEKTKRNSLETINSKEDINFNYKKFKKSFLIINDTVKNTNNSFLKLLQLLNNDDILHLFLINREIRSCIVGCLVYKVKQKIIPDFNFNYCKDLIFNDDYNFMISPKLYKKRKNI